jgi:hypothetical protein
MKDMSLYIRVANSFWNHRKTAKLRTVLGDDAFWIVPRLWSYASENQPDGDFSKYDSAEISMLLGCLKHASSIRQALIESGFMDETGCLHDWAEHNGYHAEYAARSRNAANARWEKERNRKEMKGKETSIASSMLVASDSCKHSSFKRPTLEEVLTYCHEKNYTFDPEAYMAHYESNGWMVGKNHMKNWKAACVTFQKNQRSFSGNKRVESDPTKGAH